MVDQPSLSSARVTAGDYDEALDYLHAQGMTDGLPVVPPTEERVARMVAGSGLSGDHVVGQLPPTYGNATVEKIAINAVMAGCRPEYMPVVVAAVRATLEPQFDLNAVQTTTNPVSVALVLNGPIRRQIDINCESGCMGPGRRSNASIGRAVRLLLLNLGGAVVGDVDKSTQGSPGKFTLCFGENEEDSPWPPLHVDRGFEPGQSCVTVMPPQSTVNFTVFDRYMADEGLPVVAATINDPATNHYSVFGGEPTLILNPVHARVLADAGYSKDDLKRYFHEQCRYPLEKLTSTTRERRLRRPELIVDGMAPMARRWEDYTIVVAGGHGGLHSTFFPSFGTRSVTRPIP